MFIPKRIFKILLPALTLSALVGCTTMANMPEGVPLAEVEAKYGSPNTICPAANGGQHMVWSMQPFGQYAWGTTVNAEGYTDRIISLLTDQNFRQLATGSWTEDQVICEFGQPAEIGTVGLPGSSQKVYSYRYRQNHAWNSLMYVYFDKYSGLVTRFHAGPDPMVEERVRGF